MAASFQNLEIEVADGIGTIWLNRPAIRNALDEVLIAELTQALKAFEAEAAVRVVVLGGRGKAFCAGGDLTWMKRMAGYSPDENRRDAMALATMLRTLRELAKPTIARVHGAAYAGGLGLVCACDLVVAEPAATFCLSEVRIGLVPATISPYVIQALGLQAAKRYMLTGEPFPAAQAHRLGFVHEMCEAGMIDATVEPLCAALKACGPMAIKETKALIAAVANRSLDDGLLADTAERIARVRASAEGREGVSSFLEKRKPAWLAASL